MPVTLMWVRATVYNSQCLTPLLLFDDLISAVGLHKLLLCRADILDKALPGVPFPSGHSLSCKPALPASRCTGSRRLPNAPFTEVAF